MVKAGFIVYMTNESAVGGPMSSVTAVAMVVVAAEGSWMYMEVMFVES